MTDLVPLTDEELAAIRLVGPWESSELVPRLIADLRASRKALIRDAATIAILNAEVERLREDANESYNRAAGMVTALARAEAEVERLRAKQATALWLNAP